MVAPFECLVRQVRVENPSRQTLWGALLRHTYFRVARIFFGSSSLGSLSALPLSAVSVRCLFSAASVLCGSLSALRQPQCSASASAPLYLIIFSFKEIIIIIRGEGRVMRKRKSSKADDRELRLRQCNVGCWDSGSKLRQRQCNAARERKGNALSVADASSLL